MKKKALFFSPYADVFGGGEFYFYSLAEVLINNGFSVTIAWPDNLSQKIFSFFNLDLKKAEYSKEAYEICLGVEIFKRRKYMKDFDYCFWVSDGSIPFLFAKKNWLHYQVPFQVKAKGFKNRLKKTFIDKVICNSQFTKSYIDKSTVFNNKTIVVYPYIDSAFFELSLEEKKNVIISVGRFDESLNVKRQDILLSTFKKMVDAGLKDWQLALIGGADSQSKKVEELRKAAAGYPVKIKINISFDQLLSYMQSSKIFWHAAGYGFNKVLQPQHMEHFGIAIVQAMAAGCLPLVFSGGGPKEYLESRYLWKTEGEIINKTREKINNYSLKEALKIRSQVKRFSRQEFETAVRRLLTASLMESSS